MNNQKTAQKHQNAGFIALPSLILIFSFLFATISVITLGEYNSIQSLIRTDYKRMSYDRALSCVNHAQIRLNLDRTYNGNEKLALFQKIECSVGLISKSNGFITVNTEGEYMGSISHLTALFNNNTLSIFSIEES